MTSVAKKRLLPACPLSDVESVSATKLNSVKSTHFTATSSNTNNKHGGKPFSSSSISKGVREVVKPYTSTASRLRIPTTRNTNRVLPSSGSTNMLGRHKQKRPHAKVDFKSPACISALRTLRTLFLPVLLRRALRQRRIKAWKGIYPPRTYTVDSVVSALSAPNAVLLPLPLEMIRLLAQEVTFFYLQPKESIVYFNESHLSCGIVVLLHGQLVERRPDSSGAGSKPREQADVMRPIAYQRECTHHAPDVLCTISVLCEDRSSSSLSCGPSGPADVAVIPSRWFWQVFARFAAGSPHSGMLLETFRKHIVPLRINILLTSYYPSPVLLQRSWIGIHLSKRARLKLCSAMEIMVLGAGDVLFKEGDYCKCLYFLRRGTLTVAVKGRPLSNVSPGSAFGEESALFGDPWGCTVVATSACELYTLPVGALYHRLEKDPTLAGSLVSRALKRRNKWMGEGRTRNICGLAYHLAKVPCLSHSTEAMRREIAKTANIVSVPAGYELAHRNSSCECLYVIGRGFARMVRPSDPDQHRTQMPAVDEIRGAGNFFGELCLRPHCWPAKIVSETSVDVWVLRREAILEILSAAKADAQAVVVCRQGIDLYRAQYGEKSIREMCDGVPDLVEPAPRRRAGSKLYVPLRQPHSLSARKRSHSTSSLASASLTQAALEGFDWVGYARQRRMKTIATIEPTVNEGPHSHHHRNLQWMSAVEKAMMPKACSFISVPPELSPSPVDCDFPGEVDELQAVVVEQLLLSPSGDHERFLRQLNNSNVMLVTEMASPNVNFRSSSIIESATSGEKVSVPLLGDAPLDEFPHEVVGPTGDAYLFGMETLKVPEHLDLTQSSTEEVDSTNNRSLNYIPDLYSSTDCDNSESSGHTTLVHQLQCFSVMEDKNSSTVLAFQPPQTSANHSCHARSHSSQPASPWKGSPRVSVDNRGLSMHSRVPTGSIITNDSLPLGRAVRTSSPEARVGSAMTIVSPSNVDYIPYSKHNTDRSSSLLDRLVKIKDQNYFDTLVRVIPLPQDECWIPDEVVNDSISEDRPPVPFVLVLMHLMGCRYLDPAVTSVYDETFVEVSLGERLLLRTAPLNDPVRPTWPVAGSCFIALLPAKAVLRFEVCARAAERRVLYAGTFAMAATLGRRGGVGKGVVRLAPPPARAEPPRPTDPRLAIAMVVVTAANYAGLARPDAGPAPSSGQHPLPKQPAGREEGSRLLLVGVHGLRHRIVASAVVTLRRGAAVEEVLRTPPALPKTHAPSWHPGEAVVDVQPDAVVGVELLHKGRPIASCEMTAEELVFGGVGLRRLLLIGGRERQKFLGELLVYILSTTFPAPVESRVSEKVLFLCVQRVSINRAKMTPVSPKRMGWGLAVEPDPFIVIKNGDGKVVLRTPLICASYEASWAAEDASCFLSLPDLLGSRNLYQLEVYDNEEVGTQLVDQAILAIGRDGFGVNGLFDITLCDRRATVRLGAYVLPVETHPHNPLRERVPCAAEFTKDSSLVLLHVVRFHDDATLNASAGATAAWANALWRRMQPDMVVRLKIQGEECLQTPHGSLREQWPIHAACVVLRLNTGTARSDSMAVFEIFEGVVSEADKVGEVQVPLRELCAGGHRFFSVFSSRPEMAYLPVHRLGKLEVRIFCGAVGSQVFTHNIALQRSAFFENQKYGADGRTEAKGSLSTDMSAVPSTEGLPMHARVRLCLISLSNFRVKSGSFWEGAQLVVKLIMKDARKRPLLHSRAAPILTECAGGEHDGLSAVWEADDDTIVEVDLERLQSHGIRVFVECDVCGDFSQSKSSLLTEGKLFVDPDKKPTRRVLCGVIPLKTLAKSEGDRVQVDAVELVDAVHHSDMQLGSKVSVEGDIFDQLEDQESSKPYLSFSFVAVDPSLGSNLNRKPTSDSVFIHA